MLHDTSTNLKINIAWGASKAEFCLPFDNARDRFIDNAWEASYNDYARQEETTVTLDNMFLQAKDTVLDAVYDYFGSMFPIVALGEGCLGDEFYILCDRNDGKETTFDKIYTAAFCDASIEASVIITPVKE